MELGRAWPTGYSAADLRALSRPSCGRRCRSLKAGKQKAQLKTCGGLKPSWTRRGAKPGDVFVVRHGANTLWAVVAVGGQNLCSPWGKNMERY